MVGNQDPVTTVVAKDCAVGKEIIGQRKDAMVKAVDETDMNVCPLQVRLVSIYVNHFLARLTSSLLAPRSCNSL